MNVVLVGGAGDGHRIALRDGTTRFAYPIPRPISVRLEIPPKPHTVEVEFYVLFALHPPTRTVVFTLDDAMPVDVLERLIEGYRSVPHE
jgi:hypothetical protein